MESFHLPVFKVVSVSAFLNLIEWIKCLYVCMGVCLLLPSTTPNEGKFIYRSIFQYEYTHGITEVSAEQFVIKAHRMRDWYHTHKRRRKNGAIRRTLKTFSLIILCTYILLMFGNGWKRRNKERWRRLKGVEHTFDMIFLIFMNIDKKNRTRAAFIDSMSRILYRMSK